jgi:serine protease Do
MLLKTINQHFQLSIRLSCLTLLVLPQLSQAQIPKPETLLKFSHSVAKVHVENEHGQLGVGSSVVVAKNQVATNCHVIANARGVAINKRGKSFAPIAMKADWVHDLCILIFDDLPLKPFPLGDMGQVNYEDDVIAFGFSGNAPRPTESFGSVKALIPFDDSHLIRTDSGFRMGASGGALINYDGTLIGLTTFKSPGRKGFYYSLPVKWIKQLLASPTLAKTTDSKRPFWDAPANQRPYFMQAVIPFQHKKWAALRSVAQKWIKAEPNTAEAWFYLARSHHGLEKLDDAKAALDKTISLAPTHVSALHLLGTIAMAQQNHHQANRLGKQLEAINVAYANYYYVDVGLKAPADAN